MLVGGLDVYWVPDPNLFLRSNELTLKDETFT